MSVLNQDIQIPENGMRIYDMHIDTYDMIIQGKMLFIGDTNKLYFICGKTTRTLHVLEYTMKKCEYINNDVIFHTVGNRIGYIQWEKGHNNIKPQILKSLKRYNKMYIFDAMTFNFDKYMRIEEKAYCYISFIDNWFEDSFKSSFYRDVFCLWRCYELSKGTSSNYYMPYFKKYLEQMKYLYRDNIKNKDDIDDDVIKGLLDKMIHENVFEKGEEEEDQEDGSPHTTSSKEVGWQ